MARGAAATSSTKDEQDNSHVQDAKASKRRCVQSACVPCRKRKSKVSSFPVHDQVPGQAYELLLEIRLRGLPVALSHF